MMLVFLLVLVDILPYFLAILCIVKNILTKKLRLQSANQLQFFKRFRWWETRSALFIDQIWAILSLETFSQLAIYK